MRNNFFKTIYKGDSEERGVYAGENYSVRHLNEISSQKLINAATEYEQLVRKLSSNKVIVLVKNISSMIIFLCAIVVVISLNQSKDILSYYPFLIALVVSLIVFFASIIANGRKKQAFMNSDEYKQSISKLENLYEDTKEELGIPSEASSIDIFFEAYEIVKDVEVPVNRQVNFYNSSLYCYVENNNLYMSDLSDVYEIPLSAITNIIKVEKKCTFFGWNKEQRFNSEQLKKYNIRYNGLFSIKEYYVVELDLNDEQYSLIIPNYDIDEFNNLIKVCNIEPREI